MDPSDEVRDASTVSPAEAFGILSNETRIRILRELGESEQPVAFSDLRDRVGVHHGGKFNYHLDKLVGHFVDKTDAGYTLRRPGRWVIRTISSGNVTDDPTVNPTAVDLTCRRCDAPVEVSYSRGEVRVSCRACRDADDGPAVQGPDAETERGAFAAMPLPPAGVEDRPAVDLLRAAATQAHLDALAAESGVCPSCSATVERSLRVCEDHDVAEGLCDRCGHYLAVRREFHCTNCTYEQDVAPVTVLVRVPELSTFVVDHGLDPTADFVEWSWGYTEEVLSTDPVRLRFTFTLDGESITLTVDDNLMRVDAGRDDAFDVG
jgi:DNA-binding transcriptional ArsR family regulator